ncbi:MAG: hypothetical protein ACREKI_04070, partial [Gemmatimonadota bacterium]
MSGRFPEVRARLDDIERALAALERDTGTAVPGPQGAANLERAKALIVRALHTIEDAQDAQ